MADIVSGSEPFGYVTILLSLGLPRSENNNNNNLENILPIENGEKKTDEMWKLEASVENKVVCPKWEEKMNMRGGNEKERERVRDTKETGKQ